MSLRFGSLRSDRSLWAGVLFGVGLTAFAGEVVLHQLLHWRRFYDGAVSDVGLVSEGLFHAFGWFAAVFGLVMAADASRRRVLARRLLAGGMLLGAGSFQLYDGLIQHGLLRSHRIRYDAGTALYGWTWNAVAVLLVAAGCVLLLSSSRRRGEVA